MIYFYKELKDLALKILEQKSTIDDVKAEKDLLEISNILQSAQSTIELSSDANALHIRINREYPQIAKMYEVAQNTFGSIKVYRVSYSSEYEEIKSHLEGDMYGILATVLLKHGRISAVKEFIERVD